ncbi:MAG: nitroreductase/quinone reductase family protein [Porticoccaceae bacterium]|nr:nitroreductase/quinone reductase family protein [Porticoccaceae bacterium]
MPPKKLSAFHRGMHQVASTKAGAWFLARTQHHLDRVIFKLSGGRTTLAGILTGLSVVVLSAKGAKSGVIRDIPLLCIEDETEPGVFAIVASNFGQGHHPAWYYNLKAYPEVSCTLRGQTQRYSATELEGEEYARNWGYALDTYMGFPHYKSRVGKRHIPIFAMKPV